MEKKVNLILLKQGGQVEVWGSLTKLCRGHNFSYNFLKKKSFPFEYKGLKFEKVTKNTPTIKTDEL